MLDLLDIHQAELQLLITLSVLHIHQVFNHTLHIHRPTSNSFALWTSRGYLLLRTELSWSRIFPESRYIASAPTRTENSASIVETCLPTSNGRGAESGEFIVALRVAQQQAINTRTSSVACVFRGFCASTAPAWVKRHNIMLLLYFIIIIIIIIYIYLSV
jgi:hypothetical protein